MSQAAAVGRPEMLVSEKRHGQCHPRAGDGRRAEGQFRPSRHADGHGGCRDGAVQPLHQHRPVKARLAGPRPLRALGRTWLDAAICAALSARLRGYADRAAEAFPPAGQSHGRPSGVRPRAGIETTTGPLGQGISDGRRHGAGRTHACGPLTAPMLSTTTPTSSPAMAACRKASATRRSTSPAIFG